MRRSPGIHLASVTGRARTDRAVLLLMALVAMLTVALGAAVAPATEHAADRAMADAVADAGPRGAVVAKLPDWYDDPRGKTLDPATAVQVRQDTDYALSVLPRGLAGVLRPGITSVTTPALQLLDADPGRLLQLVYVDTAGAAPAVRWTEGGPPRASDASVDRDLEGVDEAWPVQVGVSDAVADALGLQVGDRLPAKDEFGRTLTIEVSGTFGAVDEEDQAWQVSTRLLDPVVGTADGLPFSSAAALVSSESLPDLRFALPGDDLTRRVVFTPEPQQVRWTGASGLEREIASLQTSVALYSNEIAWDSQLGSVLQRGLAQVASARGQAQVLVVGLVSCALLVLVLGAQLLVVRRESTLSMVRQRGASLPGIALELLVEALPVAAVATLLGLGASHVLAGGGGWGWSVPVLLVAAIAPALLGAAAAARAGDARPAPANRSARRAAVRSGRLRRLVLEGAVLTVAVLSFTALRQRGVVASDGTGGGDVTASSAPVWWSVVGAAVLLRLLPPVLTYAMRLASRSTGSVAFVTAARLLRTGTRVLPVVVTVVAMAGITLGLALTVTVRQGQADGARSAVGGDARLDAEPDVDLVGLARDLEDVSGVRAAAAGRVEDDVRVSSARGVEVVRLLVVDPADFERLIVASDLAVAPRLDRLLGSGSGPTPALVRGGSRLVGDLTLTWDDVKVPLTVVGAAPSGDAAVGAVVVVDSGAFAAAGGVAPPNTVWAVGPGAADAVGAAATEVPESSVATYADELRERRDAPLPSALAALALVSSAVLMAFAILGTLLASAADAAGRRGSLGRLRALGLSPRDVRRVLVGELVVPVAAAGLVGLALGVGCAYAVLGSLSLELLTGQPEAPVAVVPWWSALSVAVLVASAVVVAGLEWRRVRSQSLARLLRT